MEALKKNITKSGGKAFQSPGSVNAQDVDARRYGH